MEGPISPLSSDWVIDEPGAKVEAIGGGSDKIVAVLGAEGVVAILVVPTVAQFVPAVPAG
jgi:hypothetical protein